MIDFLSAYRHRCQALRRHGVHSPFVYRYGNECLRYTHFTIWDILFPSRRRQKIDKMIEAFIQFLNTGVTPSSHYKSISLDNKGSLPLWPLPEIKKIFSTEEFNIDSSNHVYILYGKNSQAVGYQNLLNTSDRPILWLDLYYFQIIICHEFVKLSQYFKLK